jgi:hypothetical protein
MRSVVVSILLTLRVSLRDRAALELEILALRHQLQVADNRQWLAVDPGWNEWSKILGKSRRVDSGGSPLPRAIGLILQPFPLRLAAMRPVLAGCQS